MRQNRQDKREADLVSLHLSKHIASCHRITLLLAPGSDVACRATAVAAAAWGTHTRRCERQQSHRSIIPADCVLQQSHKCYVYIQHYIEHPSRWMHFLAKCIPFLSHAPPHQPLFHPNTDQWGATLLCTQLTLLLTLSHGGRQRWHGQHGVRREGCPPSGLGSGLGSLSRLGRSCCAWLVVLEGSQVCARTGRGGRGVQK